MTCNTSWTIQVIKGDDSVISVQFLDSAGVEIDITWYDVFFTVKKQQYLNDTDDTNAIISEKVSTHVDPTHWQTQITLSTTDTDHDTWMYYRDLQLKSWGGVITSTQKWEFEILSDVTRRTT